MRPSMRLRLQRYGLPVLFAGLTLLAVNLWGQETEDSNVIRTFPTPTNAQPTQVEPSAGFQIAPGDLLEIRVFNVPELAQEVRVDSAGQIVLPLIRTVNVGGHTDVEVQDEIANRLKSGHFVNDPQVMVFTKEYGGAAISVLGEVARPGLYPPTAARRLYDLISVAGGLTPRAGRKVTITHREQPNAPNTVNIAKDFSNSSQSNVQLNPSDTVVVSRVGVVYVMGDVNRPAGLAMEVDDRMTVLQAVSLSGGTLSTASLNGAKIMRRTPDGILQIPVPLKAILSAKAPA